MNVLADAGRLAWEVVLLVAVTVRDLWLAASRFPVRLGLFVAFVVASALTSFALVFDSLVCGALFMLAWWALARVALRSDRPWLRVFGGSWEACVGRWLRPRWRKWRLYDRRWHRVMHGAGLAINKPHARDELPRLKRCISTPVGDALIVQTLPDQSLEKWQAAAGVLRKSLSTRRLEVRTVRVADEPGRMVRLEVAYGADPLAVEIPALPIPALSEEIDLKRIPVGVTEAGEPWTISVLLHLLIAGQTGSGKSGVLQGLLRGLAPMIRDGLVVVHAIDMKEGVEFGSAERLFAEFADGTLEDCARLLANVVTLSEDRGRRMAERGERKHVPSVEEPLVLVVIDEMVELTDVRGMVGDNKEVGKQIAASMNQLLRKGRAKGVIVIGALTDMRVEVLPMRRHFPHRVGMRLDTSSETAMLLGEGARIRGAFCESIPVKLPGVGFAMMDGDREAVRVRAAYVTDQDIEALAAEYAPQEPVPA